MMFRRFWKTSVGKFFLLLFVCGLMAIWNPPFFADSFRGIVGTVAFPAQSVFSFFGYHTRQFGLFFTSIGGLKRENERLLSENIELRAKNAALAEQAKENDLLRKEIGLLPRNTFQLAAGEVIGRGEGVAGGSLLINIGEHSGVRKGMAVVVDRGVLIGRVSRTTLFSSIVTPLSDPESAVNAFLNTTGARGIVRGEYGLGLLFDMVLQSDTVRVGDDVVSLGLGGDIPKGLLIGTVTGVELSTDRLFQVATLSPPVRFDSVSLVFVVMSDTNLP